MSFERPTLTQIDTRARADIESTMTAVPIVRRGSVLAALARGLAGMSHSLHGHADWIFRNIFADTADSDVLDRRASERGLTRVEPSAAAGFAVITGVTDTVLPAGAALAHESGLEFTTTAAAVIVAGEASVAIEATTVGSEGNLPIGERLVFISPTAGIDSDAAVDEPGLANGAELETDARLLERLLLKMRQPPHGGATHDYVQWALDAGQGTTRVWVSPQESGLGTVTVRFVVDDAAHGPAPTEGEVAAVAAYIDQVRPVTAEVFVIAPILMEIDFEITVQPDTPEVRASVVSSLRDFMRLKGEPGQLIYLSQINEAISQAPGEIDHVLAEPTADIVPAVGVMPVLGEVVFS